MGSRGARAFELCLLSGYFLRHVQDKKALQVPINFAVAVQQFYNMLPGEATRKNFINVLEDLRPGESFITDSQEHDSPKRNKYDEFVVPYQTRIWDYFEALFNKTKAENEKNIINVAQIAFFDYFFTGEAGIERGVEKLDFYNSYQNQLEFWKQNPKVKKNLTIVKKWNKEIAAYINTQEIKRLTEQTKIEITDTIIDTEMQRRTENGRQKITQKIRALEEDILFLEEDFKSDRVILETIEEQNKKIEEERKRIANLEKQEKKSTNEKYWIGVYQSANERLEENNTAEVIKKEIRAQIEVKKAEIRKLHVQLDKPINRQEVTRELVNRQQDQRKKLQALVWIWRLKVGSGMLLGSLLIFLAVKYKKNLSNVFWQLKKQVFK
jgi:hypothetical protein